MHRQQVQSNRRHSLSFRCAFLSVMFISSFLSFHFVLNLVSPAARVGRSRSGQDVSVSCPPSALVKLYIETREGHPSYAVLYAVLRRPHIGCVSSYRPADAADAAEAGDNAVVEGRAWISGPDSSGPKKSPCPSGPGKKKQKKKTK